jgi:hypothetical protein
MLDWKSNLGTPLPEGAENFIVSLKLRDGSQRHGYRAAISGGI